MSKSKAAQGAKPTAEKRTTTKPAKVVKPKAKPSSETRKAAPPKTAKTSKRRSSVDILLDAVESAL